MARPNSKESAIEDTPPSPPPISKEMRFEAALTELEQIVQNMEGGDLSLEESISAYHRGSELLKHCQRQLSEAERKIQLLENGTLRDFDPSGEES